MPLYEHVFIARQDVSAAQVESLVEDFTKIIQDQGGNVKNHEYWGLKTMAYRIKKNRKGHYVLMNIDAESAAVAEMERNIGLHEDVLRQLTLRVDAFDEGPSVMMQGKRDGDRRGGPRGDRRDERPRDDRPRDDRPAGDRPTEEKPGDDTKTAAEATQSTADSKPAADEKVAPAETTDDAAAQDKDQS